MKKFNNVFALFLFVFLGMGSFVSAQIVFIGEPTNGGNGSFTGVFNQQVAPGAEPTVGWRVYGAGITDVGGQGSICRVIVRGNTSISDTNTLVASDIVCTVNGVYIGDLGNDDQFSADLSMCGLPPGRYSVEVQCDEMGGDYDNTITGANALTTWDYSQFGPYYAGTPGACLQPDPLDYIPEENPGQLEYFSVGDADVYRSMVVINGLFMDMTRFQPGNPELPSSLDDLQTLWDPACVGVSSFNTNGFCSTDVLTLDGAETNTFKDDCGGSGTADVTGNRLFYRVYMTGSTPGAFTSFNIPFMDNCGGPGPANVTFPTGGSCQAQQGILDQRWQTVSAGVDLIALANSPGVWMIDFYTETDIVDCSGTAITIVNPEAPTVFSTSFTRNDDSSGVCTGCAADNGSLMIMKN